MNKVIRKVLGEINPDTYSLSNIKRFLKSFQNSLSNEFKAAGHKAQISVGGSFAKNTIIRKDKYDVDIFVRFDWRFDDISSMLEESLKKTCSKLGIKYEKIHGSRDYFRVYPGQEKFYLEVIPVTKIKNPREARNVTDLSYFHVNYVKKMAKGKEDEIRIAKRFFQAQGVYGAESYVQGFSGYGIECLIIHYGSFMKMLRELVKVKLGERLVIDLAKHYKTKKNVFFDMNESKIQSPIILVDPTFSERNTLASLSNETFEKFQESARKFLKNPDESFFVDKKIDTASLTKKSSKLKAEFICVRLETDRQEGDIAGTKLKKFHKVLEREIGKYFEIEEHHFVYDEKKSADVFIIAKSKKEIVVIGPPVSVDGKKRQKWLDKHIEAFKRENKHTYVKSGFLHAKIKVDFSLEDFVKNWAKNNKPKLKEMGITEIKTLKNNAVD